MSGTLSPWVEVRQDLVTDPQMPTGFIADKVLPRLNVFQWTGSRAFAPYSLVTTATGRDANGNIIGRRLNPNIISYDVSQTTAEVIDRNIVSEAAIQNWGSVEAAEKNCAMFGVLVGKSSIEQKVANYIMGPNAPTMIANGAAGTPIDLSQQDTTGNTIYLGLLAMALALRPYASSKNLVMVGNVAAFNALRALPNMRDLLKATGNPLTSTDDVMGIAANRLASIFRVDEVIEAITPTAIWPANRIAVLVRPDPSLDPAMVPQLGRLVNYCWTFDGLEWPLKCQTTFLTGANDKAVDVMAYVQPIIANSLYLQYAKLTPNG